MTGPAVAPPIRLLAGREAAMRRRQRPALWATGAALVAVGGLGAATLVGQAGDRVEVLAVTRLVPVGQPVGEKDLSVARVAADPALRPVPASDRARVVGLRAAVQLQPGTLLTADQVTQAVVPAAGEEVVGVAVGAGQLPARGLRPGDEVLLVPVPGEQTRLDGGEEPTGEPVPARVDWAGPPDVEGKSTVDVVVNASVGARVAALASTGRVALVLRPAGGS